MKRIINVLGLVALALPAQSVQGADWPQWGGSPARNNTPDGKDIPVEWNVGKFDRKTGGWLRQNRGIESGLGAATAL